MKNIAYIFVALFLIAASGESVYVIGKYSDYRAKRAIETQQLDSIQTYLIKGVERQDSVDHIIFPPHAYMWFNDSSVTVTMSVNNWYQVTNDEDSIMTDFELYDISYSGDSIILEQPGDYEGIAWVGLNVGSDNNAQARVITSKGALVSVPGGSGVLGQYNTITVPFYVEDGESGDRVWIEFRNITDNDDFSIIAAGMWIKYLHP